MAVPAASRSTRLRTLAVLLTCSLSARAALLERRSWTKRIRVASSTMVLITAAAWVSRVNRDTTASRVSSRLKGLL